MRVWSDYGRYKFCYVLIKGKHSNKHRKKTVSLGRCSQRAESPDIHLPISATTTTTKATNLLNTIKISANEIGNLHTLLTVSHIFHVGARGGKPFVDMFF